MGDFSGLLGKFVVARFSFEVHAKRVAGKVVGAYINHDGNIFFVLALLRPVVDMGRLIVVPLVTAKLYENQEVALNAYDELDRRCL